MTKDLVTVNGLECAWCGDEIPKGSCAFFEEKTVVCEKCYEDEGI